MARLGDHIDSMHGFDRFVGSASNALELMRINSLAECATDNDCMDAPFKRFATVLALVATLALALLPSMGRMQLAQSAGAAVRLHVVHANAASNTNAEGAANCLDSVVAECTYCLLLSAAVVGRIVAFGTPEGWSSVPAAARAAIARERQMTGLGARGPPGSGRQRLA